MTDGMKAAIERVQSAPVPAPESGRGLDVVARWPDLFDGVGEHERGAIRQAFAANWHEGWAPNRTDVADVVSHARGDIDLDEYIRRARERAEAAVPDQPDADTRR